MPQVTVYTNKWPLSVWVPGSCQGRMGGGCAKITTPHFQKRLLFMFSSNNSKTAQNPLLCSHPRKWLKEDLWNVLDFSSNFTSLYSNPATSEITHFSWVSGNLTFPLLKFAGSDLRLSLSLVSSPHLCLVLAVCTCFISWPGSCSADWGKGT